MKGRAAGHHETSECSRSRGDGPMAAHNPEVAGRTARTRTADLYCQPGGSLRTLANCRAAGSSGLRPRNRTYVPPSSRSQREDLSLGDRTRLTMVAARLEDAYRTMSHRTVALVCQSLLAVVTRGRRDALSRRTMAFRVAQLVRRRAARPARRSGCAASGASCPCSRGRLIGIGVCDDSPGCESPGGSQTW